MRSDVQLRPWHRLAGKIAPEVMHAPVSPGDEPDVHERVVGYLERNGGTPWADHLALMAAVMTARRRDVSTVCVVVHILHPASRCSSRRWA